MSNKNKYDESYETYDNHFDKNAKNQEKLKMMTQEQIKTDDDGDDHEVERKIVNKNSVLEKVRNILNSHRFHTIIIILVVVDCCLVAGELIIDWIEIHLEKESVNDDRKFLQTKKSHLDTAYRNLTDAHSHHDDTHKSGVAQFLKTLELICKYGSFSILSFFIIEIAIKAVVMPKNCCKFFEVFDAFVVIVSWSMNLFLMIVGVAIHALSGLMTIFR
jgi:hypothetical protein